MKITEIIAEGHGREKMRPMHKLALDNLNQYDQLDNNANPYLAYRFGVALAGSPAQDMDQLGTIGSNFHMIDYSSADEKIRKGAEKVMGIKPSRSTGSGSVELTSVNTQSPVAQKPKNKYGV